MAIRSGGKMAQLAGAFGEPGQHGVAMRNRFIAGKLDAAVDRLRRLDGLFFHAQILPRRYRGPRSVPTAPGVLRVVRASAQVNLSGRPVFAAAIVRQQLKSFSLCVRIMNREKHYVRARHRYSFAY